METEFKRRDKVELCLTIVLTGRVVSYRAAGDSLAEVQKESADIFRFLARRLARDLEACVKANKYATTADPRCFLNADEFDRRFRRAERTLARFREYELSRQLKPRKGRKG